MVAPISLLSAVSQFETEFYISGLAPLCDQLVVLSYVKEVSEKSVTVFSPVQRGGGGGGAHCQHYTQMKSEASALCQARLSDL